jgi:hypothetical protein
MIPVILLAAELVTDTAELVAKPILAAVKAPVVIVRPVKGVIPPTAPENVVLPAPAAIVKVCAPSTVLENDTLLLVVVRVVAAPKVTGIE